MYVFLVKKDSFYGNSSSYNSQFLQKKIEYSLRESNSPGMPPTAPETAALTAWLSELSHDFVTSLHSLISN